MKRARAKGKKASKIQKSVKATESKRGNYSDIVNEIQNEKKENGKVKKSSAKGTKAKAKKRKKALTLGILIVAVLLFAIMGLDLFDDKDILAPLEDGKINVLLLGVDEQGLRTDAIMVASYDVNEGNVNLLSIPRDTKIRIENKKMTKKINGIHAISAGDGKILGVQAMAETVSQLTGIPINYYVEFSFLSIDHLFNALGPVTYDVPDVEKGGRGMNYDDPYQNLHIHLKPGLQELSGNQVQQFLRYRKSNYHVGTGSDTDRVKRQQDFVKAVIDQKMSISLLGKIPSIYSQLSKEIRTNISIGDIMKYIRHLTKLSGDKLSSFSLPGEAKTIASASYFVCDIDRTKTLMRDVFGTDGEVSDKVVLSGKNPQKPLIAGNMTNANKPGEQTDNSADAGTKQESVQTESVPKKTAPKAEPEESENEPDGEEEEKPEIPVPESNKTPLEEIYNLDE